LALARVAQVTGDPAGPVLEALAAQLDAEQHLIEDLKRTVAETMQPPATVLTDKQVDQMGRRVMQGCEAWSRHLVRASYLRSWALLTAVLLGVAVLGFGAGWRSHAPVTELACTDQTDGSRLCWLYQRLPAAPPAKR
jgi:hypothetical protein